MQHPGSIPATPKVLVAPVGTTPAPLIFLLGNLSGILKCFFLCSAESHGSIRKIISDSKFPGDHEAVQSRDVNRLDACIEASRELLSLAEVFRAEAKNETDLVVDLTGGTKVMIAALTMMSVRSVSYYSYVGAGKSENRNIAGKVISGREELYIFESPFRKKSG